MDCFTVTQVGTADVSSLITLDIYVLIVAGVVSLLCLVGCGFVAYSIHQHARERSRLPARTIPPALPAELYAVPFQPPATAPVPVPARAGQPDAAGGWSQVRGPTKALPAAPDEPAAPPAPSNSPPPAYEPPSPVTPLDSAGQSGSTSSLLHRPGTHIPVTAR